MIGSACTTGCDAVAGMTAEAAFDGDEVATLVCVGTALAGDEVATVAASSPLLQPQIAAANNSTPHTSRRAYLIPDSPRSASCRFEGSMIPRRFERRKLSFVAKSPAFQRLFPVRQRSL